MLLSNSTNFRPLTFDRYLIVDYERSNFSVNPCIFADNAQQNISPIRSIDSSNETGTNTSNGTSSPTHYISPAQSLSSPAVAGITIAAVLGLLILLACFTLFIFTIRRRRLRSPPCPKLQRYRKDAFGELHAQEPGLAPKGLQRTWELNELQGPPCGLGDIESLQHETEGIKYSPFPQDLRQKFARHPAMKSTSKVASASDISSATSPSSLTSEHVLETANDSDQVLTSSHSTPTKIIEPKTDNMPSFDVLEAGHWTLAIWPLIAENIRIRYRDVVGAGNAGSINLLACRSPGSLDLNSRDSQDPLLAPSSAAICISCKYPDRVNRSVLQDILGPLKDLPIFIRSGSIRRSGYEEGCWCTQEEECLPCQGKRLASEFGLGPAAYGRYMQRPDCGASIGVNDASLERERVSLGGYILLNIGNQWVLKAVTCHHLIDGSSVETPGIQSLADGTSNSGTPGVKYSIQSSAKIDHDGEVKRLRQRVQDNNQSSRKVESKDIMDAYEDLANAELRFGDARCSSGIAIDAVENLQV